MAYTDEYEDNNEYLNARRINIGTTQTHSLPSGDIDWVFFDVTTPGSYTIETSGSGDTTLYLYEYKYGDISYIDWDDDDGDSLNAKVTATLSAGTYVARIAGYSTSTQINSYYVTLTQNSTNGPVASSDQYENDNSRFKAKTLTVGTPQSHTIHSATDEDWIRFTVAEDGYYTVQTTGGDTYLEIYTFENQAFTTNDDRGNGDFTSLATVWLYEGTTYYARISGYNDKIISYSVSVTSGVVADAYESNNDNTRTSTTSTLTPGNYQKHTIHSSSDVDWIKVEVDTSGAYAFIVSSIDLEIGFMDLKIYNSSGTLLASDSGENPFCYGDNVSAGTYYMRVAAAESGVIAGQYHAIVCQNDVTTTTPDEYEDDDEASRAHRITTGETQTRSLSRKTSSSGETTADVDWVYFEPTVTGTYSFSVYGTSAPISSTLYTSADDEDGLLIPVTGGGMENYLIAGMRYYLKIEADYDRLNVAEYYLSANLVSTYTPEADAYENDNTASTARVITVGNPQAHSLHTSSDVDWVKFTATSSGYYTFYTGAKNGNAGDGDLMIGLYDASGTLLAYDDDSFSGYNPMVSYNMTAGQTYYAVVMSARTNQVVPYYTLSVEQGIIWDSYDIYMDERSEDDNAMERAVTHELGKAQTHTIHSSDDVDWACFSVDATGNYTIQTSGNGDTLLYIYDEDGNFIKMDDDSGVGRNASVTLTMQAGRWYYAKVASYRNALIPSYTLALTEATGGGGDAYESDNTAATASGIVAGETQSHSIHVAGDEDWVRLRPIQSGTYQIQTSGDADMKLDLYAANGTTLLASDDDSGVGLNARIGYVLNANTDYYIRAYTYSSNTTVDNYGLSVAFMVDSELGDEYENDDSPTNAKPLTLGATQTHSIHISGDVDWVTFTPTVSAEYTIQTVGSGLNCDTQLYLYSSLADAQAGRYLQWDDDGGADRNALISRVLTAGTTYYIKAKAWSTYTIPSYGLKVTQNNGAGAAGDVNQDEYENDNLSGDCKPIAVGREYTHSIHRQSDTDWVRFFTHQTGTYTIQTTGDSDMSFIIYKRIPGGALVPYEEGSEISYGGAANNALYRVTLETDHWYYVRVTTTGRRTTSSAYGIRVDIDPSSVNGDQYEKMGNKPDDNAPSRATWITLGYAQIHSIHAPGDKDWYCFKASNSGEIIFSAETENSQEMRLYFYHQTSSGDLEYITQTNISSYGYAASTLATTAGEVYYVRAEALSATQTISSYSFVATYVKDQYEDDNTSSKATLLTLGTTQTHNIHTQTDEDWFRLDVTSSGTYEFETAGDGDTYAILYKSVNGSNQLVTSTGTGGDGNNIKISADLDAGTYYLRITGQNNSLVENYIITARRPITLYDEPNNTQGTATTLTLDATRTGSFHSTTDVDYFRLTATEAGTYKFTANSSAISIELTAGGQTVRASGSAEITLSAGTTIYARLSHANQELLENYTVSTSYTAPVETNPAENYVVLFAGGANAANNHPRYYHNFQQVYNALVENYNIPRDHIYVLFADGTDSGADLTTVNNVKINSDLSYANGSHVHAATKSEFTAVMNELAQITDSNDHLLMYVYDHGSGSESSSRTGEERICTWGFYNDGGISGAEYNQLMSNISAGYQTHLFAQCYAGGILDALDMTRDGIKVWGAAADTHYSPSTSYVNRNTGIGAGGFAYEVMQALSSHVTSTSQFAQYVITDNIARINGDDDPYQKGEYFAIFA